MLVYIDLHCISQHAVTVTFFSLQISTHEFFGNVSLRELCDFVPSKVHQSVEILLS